MTRHDGVHVSVVVPVYRQWDKVSLTVAALVGQHFDPARFEVIVVDNGPRPVDAPPTGVRYRHEPRGFSYAARNAGAAMANGQVLAFTDADCVPSQDWIEQGLNAMHATGADIVGGGVVMSPAPRTWIGRYDAAYGIRPDVLFRNAGVFPTANMFVRREVFDSLGGFDDRLQSGGDGDFCVRANAKGFALHYAPQALVYHTVRESLSEVLRKNRRLAGGGVDRGKVSEVRWLPSMRAIARDCLLIITGRDTRVVAGLPDRLVLAGIFAGMRTHWSYCARRALREPQRDKDMH